MNNMKFENVQEPASVNVSKRLKNKKDFEKSSAATSKI